MGIGFRELLVILSDRAPRLRREEAAQYPLDSRAAVRGFKKSMNEGDEEEAGKKLSQETHPDADFSSAKGDRDNADSSKNA